jgi:hypothetical protein
MSTSKLFSLNTVLAASLLVGCADAARDERSMCTTPEHLAAYELAYGWSEESSDADDLDASGLREVESAELASCALSGTRAALRKKRGGGRHGGRHHGRGRDGRGHRGGGHHGSRDDDRGCGQNEDGACRDDGRFAGRFAAAAYCELSITLGGLEVEDTLSPGEESRCSRKYEDACTRAFDEAAREFAEASGDPAADCRPFRSGEFREAYEVARFNACLFSLADSEGQP